MTSTSNITLPYGENDIIQERLDMHAEPIYAIIFPFFVLIIGVIVFSVLKHYKIPFPFAAAMFIIGIAMGIASVTREDANDQLTISILQWSQIEPDVLLAVLIPGLIFREAIEVNLNLFYISFWQIVILAYPMVLMGTMLIAIVGSFIFPYGWSFSVAATLGAIISSTDPAAVAAILNEAGAPPRLKVHISGESLLNDGSSYVFFIILSTLAYNELGLSDESITVGDGFMLFLREALGGLAVGIAAALSLVLILLELDRRLDREYDVLQVVAALSMAYIAYYVADAVLEMSGIVAVSTTGIVASALGKGLINDEELMDTYLALMEQTLSIILFTLGGVIWGVDVSATESHPANDIKHWAYLLLLYVLSTIFRFVQVGFFYPVFARIGLKSSWREAVFLSYAGIRGAIAIAIALYFYRDIVENPRSSSDSRELASLFMFMAGGVSLLSLTLKGLTAGAALKLLGLTKPSTKGIDRAHLFQKGAEAYVLSEYVRLVGQPRFENVNVFIVEVHVPYLISEQVFAEEDSIRSAREAMAYTGAIQSGAAGMTALMEQGDEANSEDVLVEMRELFLDFLIEGYDLMSARGELDNKEKRCCNADVLKQSVDFALASVEGPLNDWEYTLMFPYDKNVYEALKMCNPKSSPKNYHKSKYYLIRALCFIEGHRLAEAKLQEYVYRDASELQEAGRWRIVTQALTRVLEESRLQVEAANKSFDEINADDLVRILSHYVATILLNQSIGYIESQSKDGVLNTHEAHSLLSDMKRLLDKSENCWCSSGIGLGGSVKALGEEEESIKPVNAGEGSDVSGDEQSGVGGSGSAPIVEGTNSTRNEDRKTNKDDDDDDDDDDVESKTSAFDMLSWLLPRKNTGEKHE